MGVQITYFVHGTTTDNEKGIATGCNQGELSEAGIKQSKELGKKIAGRNFDAIFCSNLKRAVDSAQLVFGGKYKITQNEKLREVNYGDWNGKKNTFKDKLEKFIGRPFPNGESYQDVEKRMREFILSVSQSYNNMHVAIVAHQAPQLALEVIANQKTWKEAIDQDWRKKNKWQPGWEYKID